MNLADEAERDKLEELFRRHASPIVLTGTYRTGTADNSIDYYGPIQSHMMDFSGLCSALTELGIATWEDAK
jgi:hypothetical protein